MFRLFGGAEPADGAAPALEAFATGVSPAMLDAVEVEASPSSGRRDREADAGADMLVDTLGAKLLHGWLQNRHQTLLPLNLNLAYLSADQKTGLARILASLLLAGRPADEAAAAAPALRQWLAGLGADHGTLQHFDAATTSPLPLNVMFDVAHAHDLTIYAYVAALMASDPRFPVSVMLCDVIQARFDLPSAMVRSAVRRYRR